MSINDKPKIIQETQHLLKPNGSILGSEVASTLASRNYNTFLSAVPTLDSHPAIASIDGRKALTHAQVADFIATEYGPALHKLGFGRGSRIALVLPNGPELAVCLLATSHWAACVPLSANGAAAELEADLQRCGADLIIGPYNGPVVNSIDQGKNLMERSSPFQVIENKQDWTVFGSIEESAKKLSIPFIGLLPSPIHSGLFKLVPSSQSKYPISFYQDFTLSALRDCAVDESPSAPDDEVLVLFTSGTTGNKKLVPHLLGDMLTAAVTIALSWDLSPSDVSCCAMPLFHVGGIVRQVFAPMLSGGAVICCPSFDPSIFWALLAKEAFTWYYAAPTMHAVILQTYDKTPANPRLRMIANAAGGLLPSLAVQLREMFGANVLPSYGMTEAMPISSPPANYDLSKPGTSGVPVGPEVAILNTSSCESLPTRTEGPICVRGEPVFRGYGKIRNDPNAKTPESFLKDGWFNTGDLGYLDEDGYLFITGRSKEVINRGGEIISPMEVEEAVLSHPDVTACAAFSARHDILQEIVGIVLVVQEGCPRLDLKSLHEFLGERLAAPKWPQCIVFLDNLPKSRTNKLLRVKLGTRLGLPSFNDEMTTLERTFEGKCPPQGTSLETQIPTTRVSTSALEVQTVLRRELKMDGVSQKLIVVENQNKPGSLLCYVQGIDRVHVIDTARQHLDGYAVPTHIINIIDESSSFPLPQATDAVASLVQQQADGPADALVADIQKLFIDLLHLDYIPPTNSNFFHLGGSSMVASQLASKIRKQFAIACSGAEIFHHTSPQDLAKMVRKRGNYDSDTASETGSDSQSESELTSDMNSTKPTLKKTMPRFPAERQSPRNNLLAALFQLVPMFVVFPTWQISRYLLFFAALLQSLALVPHRNILTFILAYLIFHLFWITVTPLFFVAIKWIVIGRYRPGRYPIWGTYYLRWWFVEQCRKLCLRGIYGSNGTLLNFYYRLLGAQIGVDAKISEGCELAEFDLVTIDSDAVVELSTLRGFGLDNGSMLLGQVRVGRNASVGIKSVVAPNTSIPDDCHLGPVTSSYDTHLAIDEKHKRVNRGYLPEPHFLLQVLISGPITFLVNCSAWIPPILILYAMLEYKREANEVFETPSELVGWLVDPQRLPFYIAIRLARHLLSPFFYMAAAILVKRSVIGKFQEGPRNNNSQWTLLRHHMAKTIFSHEKMQDIVDVIGRHYELVSHLYRLLGAKVGKRVFWPGRQPIFCGEFDLLEIGDDVVFGSRSAIFCSTTDENKKVILCAGSNVADNCVVMPGTIVGKNAVLGSNSICPEDWYLPEGSVWFGSQGCEPACLERGTEVIETSFPVLRSFVNREDLQFEGDETTLRPFGKAIYERQATYFAFPVWLMVACNVSIKSFVAIFHTLPLLAALYGAAALLYGVDYSQRDYSNTPHTYGEVFWAVLKVFLLANVVRIIAWLVIELTAKWSLMGRRQAGRYNYDTSSYAQRWELYQLIAKIRRTSRFSFLQFLFGTPYMSWYFRLNGGKIGRDACLYPAGADPFMPEPDLVEIGDRCVVDCASLVCHLNTRGNFELQKIVMNDNCTLRTRSRLQQGVHMEAGSQLLEKSLAMTGEVLEANSVWQGCPAQWWFQYPIDKDSPQDFDA